jgi:hypothetical protein
VAPRVSVNAGYFVRWYRNFTVTDNLALAATDFDQYTVTATTDPRLEDNSGQTIGPLYDVKPDKFGLTNNYVTAASNYGKQIENWKGVDVSINARMTNGLTVRGGMSSGRTLTDSCEIRAALPETATTNPYCRTSTPFLYQWRGFATYDFPWEIQLSGTWQLNPGLQLQANRTVPNAQVKQSLSRDLAGSASNVTVNFVNPGSMYSDKINQIDLRLAKIMRWKSHRAQVGLDLYNLTNTSVATNMNFAYAPPPGLWQQPTDILPARFIKFSMQLDF